MTDLSRRAKLTPYSDIRPERVEWLWPARIPLGSVTILAGLPGLGKSQLSLLLAARLSRGDLPCDAATALVATAEDARAEVVRPRLEAAGADMSRVLHVEMATEAGEDNLRLPSDVDELEACIAEEGARLVVLDPLVAFLDGGIDSWKDASTRQALAPLARIAEQHECAVVGVYHINKIASSDPFLRVGGSVGFQGAARSVLLFARDPDDPEGEGGSRRVLAVVKSNYAKPAPSVLFEVAPILIPASDGGPDIETSRLNEIGESAHDGRGLLAAHGDPEERSAVEEAEAFLLEELAEGPRPQPDIFKLARGHGIAERTLRRAKSRLGVESAKSAFSGGWEWSLPASSEDGQGGWPPSQGAEVGHLRESEGSMRVSGPSEAPSSPEDGQSKAMATLGADNGHEGVDDDEVERLAQLSLEAQSG